MRSKRYTCSCGSSIHPKLSCNSIVAVSEVGGSVRQNAQPGKALLEMRGGRRADLGQIVSGVSSPVGRFFGLNFCVWLRLVSVFCCWLLAVFCFWLRFCFWQFLAIGFLAFGVVCCFRCFVLLDVLCVLLFALFSCVCCSLHVFAVSFRDLFVICFCLLCVWQLLAFCVLACWLLPVWLLAFFSVGFVFFCVWQLLAFGLWRLVSLLCLFVVVCLFVCVCVFVCFVLLFVCY